MKATTILFSLLLLSCLSCENSRVLELKKQLNTLQEKLDSIRIEQDILFENHSRIPTPRHYLTDDEIRNLRDSDIDHIYSTKGQGRKPVYSKDTEFENRADEYIEDNIDEIRDKYQD